MITIYPNSIKVEDGSTHAQIPLTAIKGDKGDTGQSGAKGDKGDSYTITSADYEAIAEIAEQEYATDLNTVKEDIENLEDDVDEISADVSALQTKESATERSLEMLWKLNKGQTYDIESQTESGTNDAPSGAEYETLEEVYGKSSQQTTNGYQLLDYTDLESGKIIDTTTGQEKVQNNASSTKTYVPCKATKIYFSNLLGGIRAYFYAEDKTYISSVYATSGMANVPTDTAFVKFAGATSNFAEDSSVSTNETIIEPYTGGIPQPNPSYPSEIVDVTEENFKVVGKNLWDMGNSLPNGVGYKASGYSYRGTVENDKLSFPNTYSCLSFRVNLVANRTYTFSTTTNQSLSGSIFMFNGGQNAGITKRNLLLFTFTPTVNIDEICIASNTTLEPFSIQLECGTKATSYEPYTESTRKLNYTLRGIGDYKDVMDVESGKIVRKVCYEEFSGTWSGGTDDAPNTSKNFTLEHSDTVTKENTNKGNTKTTITSLYAYATSQTNAHYYFTSNGIARMFLPNGEHTFGILYAYTTPTEESISADDLAWLRGLENLSADHTITVTDQNGNDISYLVEYIIKLSEVV